MLRYVTYHLLLTAVTSAVTAYTSRPTWRRSPRRTTASLEFNCSCNHYSDDHVAPCSCSIATVILFPDIVRSSIVVYTCSSALVLELRNSEHTHSKSCICLSPRMRRYEYERRALSLKEQPG